MTCPVCLSDQTTDLLRFSRWPLFQHPVSPDAKVEPVYCDLDYAFCTRCGHSFQKEFRSDLLEKLYRHHYYTPGVSHICHTYRHHYTSFYAEIRGGLAQADKSRNVLEIGSSSGEMLEQLASLLPRDRYCGFEPNQTNARVANEKGFEIEPAFFNAATAGAHGRRYDIVFSRHVIEHIFDLGDFFAGINAVTRANSRVLFETPALDHYLERRSIDPFHVEHVHVFSVRSLAELANRFEWRLVRHTITPAGNLVGVFERGELDCRDFRPPEPPRASAINERIGHWKEAVRTASQGKRLLVWGAGSFGLKVVNLLGIAPKMFLDANPNKAGLKYVGVDIPIRYAPEVVEDLVVSGDDVNFVIVIASTYFQEIRESLAELGWRGAVVALPEVR